MHFDLVDLRLVAAIADAGSLSKAAAAFPIALSAASNRLRRFEEQCGVAVFVRSADGMTPTPAGRLVLDRARKVLGEAEQLRDTLRELTGQQRVAVRLAGTTVANSTFLPAALGPFLADYPQVDLQLIECNSPQVLEAVQAKDIDIGVLDGTAANSEVITLPFRDDRLVLLVPEDHPLAARGQARLKDALEYPFVCLPPERAMQRFVENMAIRNARPLQIRVRAPSFDAIIELVAQQAGIAMLPETATRRYGAGMPVRQVMLADHWAKRELRICIHSWDALSVHARQLLAYLTRETPA